MVVTLVGKTIKLIHHSNLMRVKRRMKLTLPLKDNHFIEKRSSLLLHTHHGKALKILKKKTENIIEFNNSTTRNNARSTLEILTSRHKCFDCFQSMHSIWTSIVQNIWSHIFQIARIFKMHLPESKITTRTHRNVLRSF